MSFLTIDGAAEILVREWRKLYRQSPVATVVCSLLALAIGGTTTFLIERNAAAMREVKLLESQSYVTQVQLLDETRVNLRALLNFIE